jgi:hypothetical protein
MWLLARMLACFSSRAPPHLVTALAYLASPCLRFVSLFSAASGMLVMPTAMLEAFQTRRWIADAVFAEAGDQLMLRSHITAPVVWVLAIANALVVCMLAGGSVWALTASLASHVAVPALLDVRMRRQLRAAALRAPVRSAGNGSTLTS